MELQEIIEKHGINLKQEIGLALSEQEAKDIIKSAVSEVFSLHVVVKSKRDKTLELLEEIMTKLKDANSEVENGIYDPMLECAKSILNNYEIKRR